MTYTQRGQMLDCMSAFAYDGARYFELLPILYRGSDTSKITEILEEEVANGEEGIMINICDAPYEFKRTNNLLKVKKFNTCDLRVIGFEEGTGKYTEMLGAFICEYKGSTVKVGSGLTDEQRKEIWQNRDKYLDTIIEIAYFEETKDSTGKLSLRFPTFKDFRPDKTEPNY
jgi:DNA ligase-1